MSVATLGGFPCINNPILKIFAANQIAPKTDATPIAIDVQTCHQGGGALDATRMSMANMFTPGMKLTTVLKVEFGSAEIGAAAIRGSTITMMIGIISDWASCMSLTADPTAIMREPMTKYVIVKNRTR